MSFRYEEYRKNMIQQGKTPVSREEFNDKKQEMLERINSHKEKANELQEKGGFAGFIAKVATAMAKQMEERLK
ncbi:MAG: hypothetical protein SOU88_09000 [Candidatus Treponema excrementipullorum]|nr:hypothetical protein [Candidatus Treponema excrementipullorum]